MRSISNVNIRQIVPLIPPRQMEEELPLTAAQQESVAESREAVRQIIAGRDRRMLVIVGPCSIHDPAAVLEYAQRLNRLQKEMSKRLLLVMRVYFEKPRTTVGWKGLINDPDLDGSCDITKGLRLARKILLDITAAGIAAGTELLDPIIPQYTASLVSWAAIGARTSESQTHREMSSGLSMPVGFKNNTEGNLQIAVDAMQSARNPHSFLGIDGEGRTCIFHTNGNEWGHLILRGGQRGANYDEHSIAEAEARMTEAGLRPAIIVDCSHANSGKKAEKQFHAWESVLQQRAAGRRSLIGMMLESNLVAGSQKIPADKSQLKYGVSVTDACVGWEDTERMVRTAYERTK
jgi:3-deoxy-7-phosphoheptulonate synthase